MQDQSNTIENIVIRANNIHIKFTNDFVFEDLDTMRKLYEELNSIYITIESALKSTRIALDQSNNLFNKRLHNFQQKLSITNNINTHDSLSDDYLPIISEKHKIQLITSDQKYKNVAPDIKLPVTMVKSPNDLPDYNLYYLEDYDQFAIKINGHIFRGNIGNIITNNHINKNNNKLVISCMYKQNCTHIENNNCTFYHDLIDYKKCTKDILQERYNKQIHIRNFQDKSWLYTNEPQNIKNRHMRHVGSRNKLAIDIQLLSDMEKNMIRDQLIHDILVVLSINHN